MAPALPKPPIKAVTANTAWSESRRRHDQLERSSATRSAQAACNRQQTGAPRAAVEFPIPNPDPAAGRGFLKGPRGQDSDKRGAVQACRSAAAPQVRARRGRQGRHGGSASRSNSVRVTTQYRREWAARSLNPTAARPDPSQPLCFPPAVRVRTGQPTATAKNEQSKEEKDRFTF